MKKLFKHLAAAVTAAALFFSAALPAGATSTLPGTDPYPTFNHKSTANLVVKLDADGSNAKAALKDDLPLSAYRVVAADYSDQHNSITYSFSDTFKAFQSSDFGKAYKDLTPDKYTTDFQNETTLKALLDSFTAYIHTNAAKPDYTASVAADRSTATFQDVQMGQYIILANATGKRIYQTVTAEAVPSIDKKTGKFVFYKQYEVDMKAADLSSDKTIDKINGKVQAPETRNASAAMGDMVSFKLTGDVPVYADSEIDKTYRMDDWLSKALTYQAGSLKVTAYTSTDDSNPVPLTEGRDYTLTQKDNQQTLPDDVDMPQEERPVTQLELNYTYDRIKTYRRIVVTYDAALNEHALVKTGDVNNNAYRLTWNHGYQDHTTHLPTYGIIVDKITNTDGKILYLSGAEFALYSDPECTKRVDCKVYSGNKAADGNYTTDSSGRLYLYGLKEGTYYLKELVAPSGYNLAAPIKVVLPTAISQMIDMVPATVYTYTTNPDKATKDANGKPLPATFTKDGDTRYAFVEPKKVPKNHSDIYYDAESDKTQLCSECFDKPYLNSSLNNVSDDVLQDMGGARLYFVKAEDSFAPTACKNCGGYTAVTVEDTAGSLLPSTGGIGTAPFTLLGGLLMGGAALAFVTRKRMALQRG